MSRRSRTDAPRSRRSDARSPDLVLADVMMPGLDGFGLLQAIRDDPALRLHAGDPAVGARRRGGDGRRPQRRRERLHRQAVFGARAAGPGRVDAGGRRRRARGAGDRGGGAAAAVQPFHAGAVSGRGPPRAGPHRRARESDRARAPGAKIERMLGKPLIDSMPELSGQPFIGYLDEVFRTGIAYQARGELSPLDAHAGRHAGGRLLRLRLRPAPQRRRRRWTAFSSAGSR